MSINLLNIPLRISNQYISAYPRVDLSRLVFLAPCDPWGVSAYKNDVYIWFISFLLGKWVCHVSPSASRFSATL